MKPQIHVKKSVKTQHSTRGKIQPKITAISGDGFSRTP
jgi:hypothetical protein